MKKHIIIVALLITTITFAASVRAGCWPEELKVSVESPKLSFPSSRNKNFLRQAGDWYAYNLKGKGQKVAFLKKIFTTAYSVLETAVDEASHKKGCNGLSV